MTSKNLSVRIALGSCFVLAGLVAAGHALAAECKFNLPEGQYTYACMAMSYQEQNKNNPCIQCTYDTEMCPTANLSMCCAVKNDCTPPETVAPTPTGGGTAAATPPASTDKSGCKVKGTDFTFPCPLGERPIAQIIGSLIKWALGVVGGLFLVMFVYGGFLYIISGANSKNAELGQKTLVNAVMGIAIVIGAYVLVQSLAKVYGLGLTGGSTTKPATTSATPETPSQPQTEVAKCGAGAYASYQCGAMVDFMNAAVQQKKSYTCQTPSDCGSDIVCCKLE